MQEQSQVDPSECNLDLAKYLEQETFKRSLVQVPLQFEFEPVEILSKELTKFNSTSEFRVLYLGPRWLHNHAVHKQYARNTDIQQVTHPQQFGLTKLYRYPIDLASKQKSYVMRVGNYYLGQKNTVYYRAFEGTNPTIKSDEEIKFNSHFESGNLDCAVKVAKNEYDLFLRIDSNTRGHVLWYYFSVSNKTKGKVKLNICNMMKHSNLYTKNMKPFVFSMKKYKQRNGNWEQGCENIEFEEKELRYEFIYDRVHVRPLSRLSFEYQFEYQNDEVFFAYCIPYTYSLLLHDIQKLKESTRQLNILQVQTLGTSLLGVKIPLLQITDPSVPLSEKKIILVTGRIHPGESCGSTMVSGFMNHLCSPQGAQLRKQSLFLIIPMMNPDGVILGNYRTGVSGVDLNRVFHKLNKEVYPQVYHLKMLTKKVTQSAPIYLYFDFHGHSSKKNAFSYGPPYKISDTEYYRSKLLPKLISLKTPMFRYYSCSFRITEGKKETARSILYNEYNIPYTYTVEASNGSYYDQDQKLTIDFNRQRWEKVGAAFVPSVLQFIQLIVHIDRKQMVQTAGGVSRRRFTNNKKVYSDQLGVFQHSLELMSSRPTKNRYQMLIDEIKNDEKKHKKQEEDSDVSSDDDNAQDSLPKAKLAQLSKSIHENYQTVGCSEDANFMNQTEVQQIKKLQFGISRKYQLLNKTKKMKSEKNQFSTKPMIKKINDTNIIRKRQSLFNPHSGNSNSHRTSSRIEENPMLDWKINTEYLRKTHNKRNTSANFTYRSNVPKVEMSLEVHNKLINKQEEEVKKYIEQTGRKSRTRTRSLSHTQRGKKKAKEANEQLESFLYPQVFQFEEFIEENQKKLKHINRQKEAKNQKVSYAQYTKTSCPSAFYKIKQNMSTKRREGSLTTLEKGILIMNITKK